MGGKLYKYPGKWCVNIKRCLSAFQDSITLFKMSLVSHYSKILRNVLSLQKDALVLHCSWFFFQNFQLFAKSFLYGIDSSALLLSYLMIADANLTTFLFSSYEYLMRRQQQTQEMQPQRVIDLVKRLEESLFKNASSKVYCCFSFVYYNIVMLYKMVLSWKVILFILQMKLLLFSYF